VLLECYLKSFPIIARIYVIIKKTFPCSDLFRWQHVLYSVLYLILSATTQIFASSYVEPSGSISLPHQSVFHLEKRTMGGKIILRENLGGEGTVHGSGPSRGVWGHAPTGNF